MKKSTKTILITLAAIVVIAILAGSYILNNRETGGEVTPTAAPTETLEPTVGVTESAEPTLAPTSTPVTTETPTAEPTESAEITEKAEPTATEAPTVTAVPTEALAPTATPTPSPMPTAIPTPAPTNTPMPTVTPVPTATSTPTPLPVAEETPILRVQMGDNVWYEYYEGGILVVTGTGSTWDFDDISIRGLHKAAGETIITKENTRYGYTGDYYVALNSTRTIIIKEGITRIGNYALGTYPDVTKVSIPESLTTVGAYGFREVGEGIWTTPDTVEWIGLDLSKIDAHEHAFIRARGLDNMDTTDLIIQPTATPTPTPTCTPTPTPIPNPDNPRMCHSFKVGADATIEFWDNGYAYIKGTGRVDDKSEDFMWSAEIFKNVTGNKFYQYYDENFKAIDKFVTDIDFLIVEDGITYLGKHTGLVVGEIWLPESLTEIGRGSCMMYSSRTIHWYYKGKPVTLRREGNYGLSLDKVIYCIEDEAYAKEQNVTITFE